MAVIMLEIDFLLIQYDRLKKIRQVVTMGEDNSEGEDALLLVKERSIKARYRQLKADAKSIYETIEAAETLDCLKFPPPKREIKEEL